MKDITITLTGERFSRIEEATWYCEYYSQKNIISRNRIDLVYTMENPNATFEDCHDYIDIAMLENLGVEINWIEP